MPTAKPGEERYFFDQVAELWKQMGFKPFWQGEKPALARRVLFKLLCETKFADDEKARIAFDTAMTEMTKRAMLLGYPL